jgi:hypothetical protein
MKTVTCHEIYIQNGHVFFGEDFNGLILIDTGAAFSIGKFDSKDWGKSEYLQLISKKVGVEIAGLAGIDWLGSGSFVIDLRAGNKGLLTRYAPRQVTASPVLVPRIQVSVEGRKLNCALDTGAQYSYLRQEFTPICGPHEKMIDDFCFVGTALRQFRAKAWSLGVAAINHYCTMTIGVLPEEIEEGLLVAQGIDGVVGLDFFKHQVTYFHRNEGEKVTFTAESLAFLEESSQYLAMRASRPESTHGLDPGDLKPPQVEIDVSRLPEESRKLLLVESFRCHLYLLTWHWRANLHIKGRFSRILDFEPIWRLMKECTGMGIEDLDLNQYHVYEEEWHGRPGAMNGTYAPKLPEHYLLEMACKTLEPLIGVILSFIPESKSRDELVSLMRSRVDDIYLLDSLYRPMPRG